MAFTPDPEAARALKKLQHLHENFSLGANDIFPMDRGHGYITYNGVRRIAHSFVGSKGEHIGLNTFLASQIKDIAGIPNLEEQEKALSAFQYGFKNFIYGMPVAHAEQRAARYAARHSAWDYSQYASYKNSFAPFSALQQFAQNFTKAGYGVSGVGSEKVGSFMYSTKSLMALIPGASPQEYIRKFATPLDYLPVGSAAGPGSGMPAPSSMTPAMLESASTTAADMLFNYGKIDPVYRNLHFNALREQLERNSVIRKVAFTSHPGLAGGPAILREGTLGGLYSYKPSEILVDPSKLTLDMLSKLTIGNTLRGTDITELRTANLNKDADFQTLLQQGYTEREAQKRLNKKYPKAINQILGLSQEGKNLRVHYGQRTPLGPGTKVSAGLRKAVAGYMPEVMAGLPAEAEVAMSWLNSSESTRQILPAYQAAENYLTQTQFVPDTSTALANAQKIANILNEGNTAKAVRSRVRVREIYNHPTILMPDLFKVTQQHVESIAALLNPAQRQNIYNYINKVEGVTLDLRLNVLPQQEFFRHGTVAQAGVQDIMGLVMQGHDKFAEAIAGKIGRGPINQEMKSILGFLQAGTPIAGATGISSDIVGKIAKNIRVRYGALEGEMGNPIFDPTLDKLTKSSIGMLDLKQKVKVNFGGLTSTELSQLPIMSMQARKMAAMPSGTVWAGEMNRVMLGLFEAVHGENPELVQNAAQRYVDMFGKLAGKDRTIVQDTLKTGLRGAAGTLAFLSPQTEAYLASSQFGSTGEALHGMTALTMKQAAPIFQDVYGIKGKKAIMEKIRSGVYVPTLRHPAAPQGWTFSRLAIMDKEALRMTNFGSDAIMASSGLASLIHGDVDQDRITLITDLIKDKEMQQAAEQGYLKDIKGFEYARSKAIEKLVPGASAFELAGQAELQNVDVAMAAIQKARTTGIAHNAAFRVYEGALSKEGGQGLERFNKPYAKKLADVLFGLGESMIDIKRQEDLTNLNTDLIQSLYGPRGEAKTTLPSILGKHIQKVFGETADISTISGDIKESLVVGNNSLIKQIQDMNKGGRSTQEVMNVLLGSADSSAAGGVVGILRRSGVVGSMADAVGQQGAQNRSLADAAISRGRGIWNIVKEGVASRVSGLKQGKGWTSLIIGGAVLAGVGLSLRKPGNIIIEQPNAGNEPESPVIVPRRQSSARVMSNQQYDVRVRIKEMQAVDRKKFVDLAEAISGKYQSPSRTNIRIKDDTKDVNYEKVFRDSFARQMRIG